MLESPGHKWIGFSLTELFPVIAIVATLTAIVTPLISTSSDKGWQHRVHEHYLSSINAAVQRYYDETGSWPAADLKDIEQNPDYFPQGIPTNPLTGGRYKLHPTTHRAE